LGSRGGTSIPNHVLVNVATAHVLANVATAHVLVNVATAHVLVNVATAHVLVNVATAHVLANVATAHVLANVATRRRKKNASALLQRRLAHCRWPRSPCPWQANEGGFYVSGTFAPPGDLRTGSCERPKRPLASGR
jgi:hypothetical protein